LKDVAEGLLAHRACDENLGPTLAVVRRAAFEQQARRALVLGLGVETLAGLKALAPAQRHRRALAVGTADLRDHTALARGEDARIGQPDDRARRFLGGVARLVPELAERLLRPADPI
jgi:hypothetical protein